MTKRVFTDRWLRTVGPFEKTTEFVDSACPNLWIRVGRRRKTFSLMIGPAAHRRRMSIGHYPAISLVEARRRATEILSDPRASGGGQPRRGGRPTRGTVKDLFEFVIAAMESEGKIASIRDYKLYLLENADSAANDFGAATLARNVTSEMATDWLAKFHARGKSTRLPRAILSAAFNRGIKADNDPTTKKRRTIFFGLDRNPVTSVGGPTQSKTRDRSLSLEEMRRLWRDLESEPFHDEPGLILRLIIAMGGVRVTEIVRSEKAWWLNDGGWRILSAPRLALPKTKNGHPHDLPVTQHAQALLRITWALPDAGSVFLFPSPNDPRKPRTVDHLAKLTNAYCKANAIAAFTPRDLRRSMKNLLLDNDVAQVDVDIWHNHGRNADVARRNYDRAQYEHAKGRVAAAIDKILDAV